MIAEDDIERTMIPRFATLKADMRYIHFGGQIPTGKDRYRPLLFPQDADAFDSLIVSVNAMFLS